MRACLLGLVLLLLPAARLTAADGPSATTYWDLIHDEAVLADLKLTASQRKALREALDLLDLRCFPLRNQPAAEAEQGLLALVSQAQTQLGKILRPQQVQRLDQVLLRVQGLEGLLRSDVAEKLSLSEAQWETIAGAVRTAREGKLKLQREVLAAKLAGAKADEESRRLDTTAWEHALGALNDDQKRRWMEMIARDFEISRLGRTAYKTPELIASPGTWVNGAPLDPQALRGRVVVVHFFAFGCSNCIHNYPSYRKWQEELVPRGVQLIGIHTPETSAEHNVERLKGKLQAEQLYFPVIVDNDKANWEAWGNGMWPSVYVIDKQGYMRGFWAGELKWQGRDGEALLQKKIEALLTEK